jgi:hypothetical protein
MDRAISKSEHVRLLAEELLDDIELARLKPEQLQNLYDRVSTGVHNDISLEEAKILFLETYIFLGEVLTL